MKQREPSLAALQTSLVPQRTIGWRDRLLRQSCLVHENGILVQGFWFVHRQSGVLWVAHVLLCLGCPHLLCHGRNRGAHGGLLGSCQCPGHSVPTSFHTCQVAIFPYVMVIISITTTLLMQTNSAACICFGKLNLISMQGIPHAVRKVN